jgi:hypothetical protein
MSVNQKNLCNRCFYEIKSEQSNSSDVETVYSSEEKDILSYKSFDPKKYTSMITMKNALSIILKSVNEDDFFEFDNKGYTKLHNICRLIALSSTSSNQSHKITSALNFFFALKELIPQYFSNNFFFRMLSFGTKNNSKWTVIHEFFDYCKFFDKKTVRIFISLLTKSGLSIDMEDDFGITPRMMQRQKGLEKNISQEIKDITTKYKKEEEEFKEFIIETYREHFHFCSNCNCLITYLNDLKNIIKNNNNDLGKKDIFLKYCGNMIYNIIKYRESCINIFKNHHSNENNKMKEAIKNHQYIINLYQQFL